MEYDFDLQENLNEFENATGQLDVFEALQALDIDNLKQDNAKAYSDQKGDFLNDLEGDLTTDKIQDWVNEVNASEMEESDSAAVAEKVTDALENNNDIALKNALNDSAFDRVNDDWFSEYKGNLTGTDGNSKEGLNYVSDIQDAINTVNDEELGSNIGDLNDSVDKEELNEAKALLDSYATPNEDGDVTNETQDLLDTINEQLAVADVNEAPTPNTLKSALTALNEQLDDKDKFMEDDYQEDNLSLYYNGYESDESNDDSGDVTGLKDTDVTSTSDVTEVIKNVNEAVKSDKEAIDERVENVTISTQTGDKGYVGYSVNSKPIVEGKEIKSVTVELTNEDNVLAKNEATDKTISMLNEDEKDSSSYLTSPFDKFDEFDYADDGYWTNSGWDGNIYAEPTEAKVTVEYEDATANQSGDYTESSDKDAVTKQTTLTLVNNADSASEVKTALDNIPDSESNYLNVPTVDRMHIADQVLESRDDQDDQSYNAYDDLTDKLNSTVTSYNDTVKNFSSEDITGENASIQDVVEQLNDLNYDAFDNLSAGQKSKVAEVIQQNYPEEDYRTLTAVKDAVDDAIDAPAPMSLN